MSAAHPHPLALLPAPVLRAHRAHAPELHAWCRACRVLQERVAWEEQSPRAADVGSVHGGEPAARGAFREDA